MCQVSSSVTAPQPLSSLFLPCLPPHTPGFSQGQPSTSGPRSLPLHLSTCPSHPRCPFSLTHLIRTQESCKSTPRQLYTHVITDHTLLEILSILPRAFTHHLGQSLSIAFPGTASLMFQGDHRSSHFSLHILVDWHVSVYLPACLPFRVSSAGC